MNKNGDNWKLLWNRWMKSTKFQNNSDISWKVYGYDIEFKPLMSNWRHPESARPNKALSNVHCYGDHISRFQRHSECIMNEWIVVSMSNEYYGVLPTDFDLIGWSNQKKMSTLAIIHLFKLQWSFVNVLQY